METAGQADSRDRGDAATMDGRRFEAQVRAGWRCLVSNENEINALNVFPVPDGDTGTNMRMTIENGVKSAPSTENLGEYANRLAMGMLLGARGNSGVIFSQIFKGIALALKGKRSITAPEMADALVRGYEVAYSAVMYPTEGTMLTVAREGIERIRDRISEDTAVDELFRLYLLQMKDTLNRTPEMLEILKRAEVVDSGGMGLVCFFEGFLNGSEGASSVREAILPSRLHLLSVADEDTFGYCTEFILKVEDAEFDMNALVRYLGGAGKSVIALRDGDLVKVHVHTEKPLEVLEYAMRTGTFVNVKIENMDTMVLRNHSRAVPNRGLKGHREIAYVAVVQGDGVQRAFESLGCDVVINGGQTMNTSVEEFLTVFGKLDAEHIVVMPNNGNIRLAALQARELAGREGIHVLETTTVLEGYFAMSMVVGDSSDIQAQLDGMTEGMRNVETIEIARAVHDSDLFDVHCATGDYIGLVRDQIVASAPEAGEAALEAIARVDGLEDKSAVLLIRGQGLTPEQGEDIARRIGERYSDLDVGIIDGGQEVYDLLIGLT